MGYLGYKPADKPLTAADITDSIITSAKITDATIVNGDIANSTIALAKLSATGTPSASNFLRGDNSWVAAGGANTPNFSAYRNSGQSFANTTETKIQYNNEYFDTASAYDNATNYRFTVPSGQGGKYLICVAFQMQTASAVANFTVSVKKNGSTYILDGKQGGDANYPQVSSSGIVELSATDYIEAFCYHEFGSSLTSSSNPHAQFFSAFKLIE